MVYKNVNRHELNLIQMSWDTILLKFGAPWCAPCKQLDPILWDLSDATDGFCVGMINVDECPELAAEFGVMSVPTMFVLKNGKVVRKIVGVKSLTELKEIMESI